MGIKFLTDIGLIEDDDEFDEFPSENWDEFSIDQEDDQLWQSGWENSDPQESFYAQLKAQLEALGHKVAPESSASTGQDEDSMAN